MTYADIILPLPIEGVFTYAVPCELAAQVRCGVRVRVPFGITKKHVGVVCKVHDKRPDLDEIKTIDAVIDKSPVVTDMQLQLWRWISSYYMSPLGDVLKAALPAKLKGDGSCRPKCEQMVTLPEKFRSEQSLHVALDMLGAAPSQKRLFETFLSLSHWSELNENKPQPATIDITRDELLNSSHATVAIFRELKRKGLLATYEREVGRLGMNDTLVKHAKANSLNKFQQKAMDEVESLWRDKNVVLLHGVTSSGKTEIYIHLIQKAIAEGKQVLYLLPEIALTVQITERLRSVFGSQLGVYHSRHTDVERMEVWLKQLSDSPYMLILGARSAVLLPYNNLGLVIIDEEHDTSFKQQEPSPRYNARSTAIMMARMCGAKVLLGTATPSVESYHNAMTGKYGLVELFHRYKDISLPRTEIVDIRDMARRKMMSGPFSPQLLSAMRTALERGEQIILFQNRRGYSPMLMCRDCGWTPKCDNCDVALVYHKNTNVLSCHYCGYSYRVPSVCPNCGGANISDRGYGTERIEDRILDVFPEARVVRMDLDTTRNKGAYSKIIDDFSDGKTDILIGTQMVTKGLDFDRVSLVGILDADTMLNMPDFRAYEYAYAMLSQVSGRAGRKERQGRVILQTRNASMPLLANVVRNDYRQFYDSVMAERGDFRYPPFSRLVYVYLRHRDEHVVEDASQRVAYALRKHLTDGVLGPDKPSVGRVKNLHIRKIMVKGQCSMPVDELRAILRQAASQLASEKRFASVQMFFDVDPA